MSRGKSVNIEVQLEQLVLSRLRIRAHQRAVALRRQARLCWPSRRDQYAKLRDMADAAEHMSKFFESLADPEDIVFKAGSDV